MKLILHEWVAVLFKTLARFASGEKKALPSRSPEVPGGLKSQPTAGVGGAPN